MPSRPIRIANISGFYGDRLAAAAEALEGDPIDVLSGDWLAELTMYILYKDAVRREGGGWARTFLKQMEHVLGTCLDRGIRVVTNAGGLAPQACANELAALADRLGLAPTIATVTGDDLTNRIPELRASGHDLERLGDGAALGQDEVLVANAYLGSFEIAEGLARGADVVITGRVTDAALTVGPAAWYHSWGASDLDALAGAVAAGHVIECGAQATGGNYAFFHEIPGLERPGFPIAEVANNGSAVITKQPGTGGAVTVGTVTAQLLYEVDSPRYLTPDVVARFDTVNVEQVGIDRVGLSGARGESPPDDLKVVLHLRAGFLSRMTFGLTGLDIEAKAALVERSLRARVEAETIEFDLIRTDRPDATRNEEAVALLQVTVRDHDPVRAGRGFSAEVIELALANYPGLFTTSPPTAPTEWSRVWPTVVPRCKVPVTLHVGGMVIPTPLNGDGHVLANVVDPPGPDLRIADRLVRVPLGRLAGARSGDKGDHANVGIWARTTEIFEWLDETLDVDAFASLVPDLSGHDIERHRFPNLLGLNFVVRGLLAPGVAGSSRQDAQAKGLAEYLRSRELSVPARLVDVSSDS